MSGPTPRFALRLATGGPDVAAAQRLRHEVFVEELGGSGGGLTDPARRIEADRHDPHAIHLLLVDAMRGGRLAGTTRVLTRAGAAAAGGFASEAEFDLAPLLGSGRRPIEVGRTCLHPDYRGGAALHHLWQGLAGVVAEEGADVLFGLASFPGTDPAPLAPALAFLEGEHPAPAELRPRSRAPLDLELPPAGAFDRREAVLAIPPLVKAYLRLGAGVAEGAFLDRAFRCIDVCMVLDATRLAPRARATYGRAPA
ncbi:GNAT family N-acetyltransferase [Rubellimicrobium aerolatum]|uniref:L-ornithine N(alpha)-acyltransferase n=1 Tax=Rubellimicrobium aerolatum TaxID=490979 RepID=A0ABW0S843_9RHOB|nr:GNAT family N-acyltransferase [Rubellimicrobium aerolatum]MBP1804354.1 putative hemolysin [Rubellimicrobium aerolatum]